MDGINKKLSDIEVKAEVFKVIRAFQEEPVKKIIKEIRKHLKDTATNDQILIAIKELIDI